MKKVQIEFDELPFSTLERFGLTREMIEDLPMRVLEDICNGRHSPVLPVRVTDEHGGQIESRSRFAFIRMDDGQVDVVFYPALKSSPLERYDEAQQKQLLDGKAIVADVCGSFSPVRPRPDRSGTPVRRTVRETSAGTGLPLSSRPCRS